MRACSMQCKCLMGVRCTDGLIPRARRTRTHAVLSRIRQPAHTIGMCVHRWHDNIHARRLRSHDYVQIYIYIGRVRSYIYRRTHTHMRSTAASSARALAHTCTWRRCSHMHAHTYTSRRQILTYRHTYRTPLLLFIGGDIHARAHSCVRKRSVAHAQALHTCTQRCSALQTDSL